MILSTNIYKRPILCPISLSHSVFFLCVILSPWIGIIQCILLNFELKKTPSIMSYHRPFSLPHDPFYGISLLTCYGFELKSVHVACYRRPPLCPITHYDLMSFLYICRSRFYAQKQGLKILVMGGFSDCV